MSAPNVEFDIRIKEQLFNAIPMFDGLPVGIVVLNREFDMVYANSGFEKMFGSWKNQKCFFIYKEREETCSDCEAEKSFKDGVSRVNVDVEIKKNGRTLRYIKHVIPVMSENGNIPFLMEIWTDITKTYQMRKEHELLFEQVPCNVLLIDRDFRIVRTNERVKKNFGKIEEKYCFEALKRREQKCDECTANRTLRDGKMHTGHHIWKTKSGRKFHFQVSTVPLKNEDGSLDMVMETAVDVTEAMRLKDSLNFAYSFLETMVAASMDGIVALDRDDDVVIFNSAARNLFKIKKDHRVSKKELELMLPKGFLKHVSTNPSHVHSLETEIKTIDGEKTPARLFGSKLLISNKFMGMFFFSQDLRKIKQLESDKLEAERLAAVGQTVAGLAHGVKNLITALEGGMYMMNTGMNKSDIHRVQKGMKMLDRNIIRISVFVKAFLSFSKGRVIKVEPNSNPSEIANEVVQTYLIKAQELGIKLINEQIGDIEPAPIDYEGMHECLTNLVGNAIDACCMSEDKGGCHIFVRSFEKDGVITYEVVDDGCGMDYDVKRKVFTTFFTTKGLGGSGLGLLMTKKIIHEHGGKIELETKPGHGSTFRIILPRNNLPKAVKNEE